MKFTRAELEAALAAARRYPPGYGDSYLSNFIVKTRYGLEEYLKGKPGAAAAHG